MNTPVLWRRPDLVFPQPCDTIFFDVDGILIDTLNSFHATDIAVAEYIAGTLHGLDWGQSQGKPLFTYQDVDDFKQAGGYNNDWDMSYLLATLATARLREWKGTPLANRYTSSWALLSRMANTFGNGGLEWIEKTFPPSAIPDYNMVGDLYHEYYWGADDIRKRFGREPIYLPEAKGFVHHEHMLYAPDFPARLRAAGIKHLGMITGRIGPEVDSALNLIEEHSGGRWWEIVVPASVCPKPDPRALRIAIDAVGARGGIYIGDTADDHDLIRNYQASKGPGEPDFLATLRVPVTEVELYKERGADLIVNSVEDLLTCLPQSVNQ